MSRELVAHSYPLGRDGLVLGIDGGGSRTVALLAPVDPCTGEAAPLVLGRGEGGPSNFQAVGREKMEQSLASAIGAAFVAAGIERRCVTAACLGLAGADRPADRQLVLDWCDRAELAAQVTVVNDGRLVMAAGTPSDWGVAVIAGTGSFALARSRDGQMRRAGGWGYLFGDEGSAYAIALSGLKAVTRAHDGSGPATALMQRILERMQIADVKSIVPAIYGCGLLPQGRSEIARLADVVTGAAEAGDAVALACLDRAADELATTACAAAKLFTDGARDAIPVALAGSLLTNCCLYADKVLKKFRQGLQAELNPVTSVAEPATGAVRLARRLLSDKVAL